MKLTHSRVTRGVWQAHLSDVMGSEPKIEVRCDGERLVGATLTPIEGRAGHWQLDQPLPGELMSDEGGLVSVVDLTSAAIIGMLQISAGPTVDVDTTSEVARLREELELLKEVVRKHLRS